MFLLTLRRLILLPTLLLLLLLLFLTMLRLLLLLLLLLLLHLTVFLVLQMLLTLKLLSSFLPRLSMLLLLLLMVVVVVVVKGLHLGRRRRRRTPVVSRLRRVDEVADDGVAHDGAERRRRPAVPARRRRPVTPPTRRRTGGLPRRPAAAAGRGALVAPRSSPVPGAVDHHAGRVDDRHARRRVPGLLSRRCPAGTRVAVVRRVVRPSSLHPVVGRALPRRRFPSKLTVPMQKEIIRVPTKHTIPSAHPRSNPT